MEDESIFKKTSKSISENAESLLSQLKSGLSKLSDIGTASKEKFINYVQDVFTVLPLIEKAGFRTNRLIVGVSIPPSVEIHFSRYQELTDLEMNALKEEHADEKMFSLILKALLLANDFQSKLSSETLVFSETCIEISIPPKISIKYLHKDLAQIQKLELDFD